MGYPWFTKFNPSFNWKNNILEGEEVEIDTAGYRTKLATTLRAVETTQESAETEKKAILKQIPAAYHQYWEVFSERASYRFPPEREEDHAIILKEGAPDKIDCKIYRQTAEELEATRQFITESLAKGYITDSKSPYASALFYRKKKDGKLRPIMDYCILNKWTVRDNYPLPPITNIIERLQGKTLFRNLIFDGATTISESKRKTGGKQPSKLLSDFTNLLSCILDSQILQPLSAAPCKRCYVTGSTNTQMKLAFTSMT